MSRKPSSADSAEEFDTVVLRRGARPFGWTKQKSDEDDEADLESSD